jgi:HTH-type transcriptional regulator/antitoxin HipB
LARIPVRAGLAAALEIRWARQDAGLSQAELGKRAGVKQQQIAKIENPDENPTLQTIEKVAKALGLIVSLGLEDAAATARSAASPSDP